MEERLPRKLAAILYADVAGYSRLTGEDEEGTHRKLSEYLDVISDAIGAHRGRVVHYAGDAVLAEFGTVSDALDGAVFIQSELNHRNERVPDERKLLFRIGVNLGEVIVDRDDIFGDGVNVAARLESLAEPGGICISGTVYDAIGEKLSLEYEFMGEQSVKNVLRPVRAFKVLTDSRPSQSEKAGPDHLATGSAKPSVAVMPFTNMSGDAGQEYFSDGVTEDIITELSRFSMLFVIARHSSFAFKGQAIDRRAIAEKLGVQYVVEGSVRRSPHRLRITIQLVESSTGRHVWAERYDCNPDEIFVVQDEVVQTVAATLAGRLADADADRAKRKRPSNLTAYDYFLQGNQLFNRFTREGVLEARTLYAKAMELDPMFARARARFAAACNAAALRGWDTHESVDETMQNIQQALELDPNDNWIRETLGYVLLRKGQFDEAEAEFEKALSLNPNDADTINWTALAFVLLGRASDALELVDKAMRLNPLHPDVYHRTSGQAAFFSGQYERAVRAFARSRILDSWIHAYVAAANAYLGHEDEARSHVARFVEARRSELEASGEALPVGVLALINDRVKMYRLASDRERLIEGLRMAGLSE